MIDKSQAQEICNKVLGYVSEGQAEVSVDGTAHALTRVANNTIHQNVDVGNATVSLRVDVRNRSGRASTNALDDASLQQLCRDALAAAKSLSIEQELPPMLGPQAYREIPGLDQSTVRIDPMVRAEMVERAVAVAKSRGTVLAGLVANTHDVRAMANTSGLFAYHAQSWIEMELTAMAGGAAGRSSANARSLGGVDPAAIAKTAVDKCLGGRNPKALDPGAYTVILEPEAATTPLSFMAWLAFGAQDVQEGLSCLSGRIGQRLFGTNVTIADDAYHPLLTYAMPFDGEGAPKQRVMIIDRGVAATPVYDQKTAAKDGVRTTGHGFPQPNTYGPMPQNLVMEGGATQLDAMIAATERGILVTRFWYNRVVDRKVPVITGMTRDGTFLVENGKVVCGIKNMRYNQDLVEFFNNVTMLGPQQNQHNDAVPPLVVREFHFTGRTE
jgi:PmbA protein